jgi:acetyl-CoA C-acetyltransferase
MTSPSTTPVLVGVGQYSQRLDDPREGKEPLAMMIAALQLAADDAGTTELLARADSVRVIRGVWPYGDPARAIAQEFGADEAESVGTPWGGNSAQACVNDAASDIQAGRCKLVLIAGGENGRSSAIARRQGIKLEYRDAPGESDRGSDAKLPLPHSAEVARGIFRPTEVYAVFESAIRAARGESIDAHAKRISELWAGFNAVACENSNAWIRKPYSAAEIRSASPDNPMINLPYPRLMNSNNRVDMGAGLIVCSLEVARELGVPDEKIVYLHAGTEANDSESPSTRYEFHRSPAIRIAGSRALELAGKTVADIDHFDLYSCFPSAVQVAATELGIPQDRPLSVTGGLTFGGGPLNDYVLHSIARMAEVLRAEPGSFGMVTANGGFLSKHAFGIYSTEPPSEDFQHENLQAQVDALPLREALENFDGPVTIEAYTVRFLDGVPATGFASCLTEDGARTWAKIEEPELLEMMSREEFCGRAARLDGSGGLELIE